MSEHRTISKALNVVYLTLLSIIVAGMFFVGGYIYYQAHRDPVQYNTLTLTKDTYETSDSFTYKFATCRTAGPSVSGQITRQFIPVEKQGDEWVQVKGKAPVLLFSSINVTNDTGCRESTITSVIPIMDSGYYRLRITGNYNVLQILPPSVDTADSNVVNIVRSKADEEAVRSAATSNTMATEDQASQQAATQTVTYQPPQASPQQQPVQQPATTVTNNTTNTSTSTGSTPIKNIFDGLTGTVEAATNGVNGALKTLTGGN